MAKSENFIHNFVSLFKGTQVPELYALWSALAGVSALLGRRIHFKLGRITLYPNLCAVLVAASGQAKSTPINAMEDILKDLPPELRPNILPCDSTPQFLIKALATKNASNALSDTNEGFGFFSEFGTFMPKGAYEGSLPELLINLIDCRTHDKGTIMRGMERVVNPCLGFIGGTTIDYVRSAIPEGALGGGLASRFIFVHVEGRGNPCVIPQEDDPQVVAQIKAEAIRISQLRGEMTWSDEVFERHHYEFNRFWTKSPFWNSPQLVGYARRRDKHILKIAMLWAVAAGESQIQIGHYEAALGLLYKSEQIMPRVMQKIASSLEGSRTETVLEFISREPEGVPRSLILRQFISLMNTNELSQILTSLVHSGQVSQSANGAHDTKYRSLR